MCVHVLVTVKEEGGPQEKEASSTSLSMPPVAIPPVLKLHDWVWSQKRASREAAMGGGGVEHPRAGMIEEKGCWDFALYQSEAWKRVPMSLRSRSPKTLGWNSPAHGLRLLAGPPHPSNRQIWAPFGQADGRWCPCVSYFWRKDAVQAMRKVFLMDNNHHEAVPADSACDYPPCTRIFHLTRFIWLPGSAVWSKSSLQQGWVQQGWVQQGCWILQYHFALGPSYKSSPALILNKSPVELVCCSLGSTLGVPSAHPELFVTFRHSKI